MARTKITSGMWRLDPLDHSRVLDRFGRTVAIVDSESEAYLIASAPDMCEVLESLEKEDTVPHGVWQEVQLVLRRVRGDFGLVFSHRPLPRFRRLWNQEWLKFMNKLWNGSPPGEVSD